MRSMNAVEVLDTTTGQQDSNDTKSNDLEENSLKDTIASIQFKRCLEIGCGSGKNTRFLLSKASHIMVVDTSMEILMQAQERIQSFRVVFQQADLSDEWTFSKKKFDMVIFSMVLGRIERLDDIFRKASTMITPRGYMYIGERHPFKHFTGSGVPETNHHPLTVPSFNHHISDLMRAALRNDFELIKLNEYFDETAHDPIPAILTLLIRKRKPRIQPRRM